VSAAARPGAASHDCDRDCHNTRDETQWERRDCDFDKGNGELVGWWNSIEEATSSTSIPTDQGEKTGG
jgi:hypothetical protein